MLRTLVSIQVLALAAGDRVRRRLTDDRGQSTAEYALVLLGAAGVALLLSPGPPRPTRSLACSTV